jgi:hypothetical protein
MAVEDVAAQPAEDTPPEPRDVAATTALAQRDPSQLIMSDDEIRRTYRLAEALWQSGAWKDVKKAEQAFAKIIIGRDLGLTPAQSMQGIHLVDGGIQMHYAQMGQFVRARPGYEFRSGFIKRVTQVRVSIDGTEPEDGEIIGETTGDQNRKVFIVRFPNGRQLRAAETACEILESTDSFVWLDEEDPLDDRPVFGAATLFTVDGDKRGLSRYTLDDARRANLIKADARAAWNTSHRNMVLARSMSNGMKWIVPEVMNGMPVYAPGELREERKSLTAPAGDAAEEQADAGTGIELGPKVEALIERATALGHRGLSNRGAVEMAIGNRAPGVVNDWIGRATAELDRFAAEKEAAAETQPEDAEQERPEEQPVEVPEEQVSGIPEEPAEPGAETPPADGADPPDAEVVDDPQARLDAHLSAEDRAAGLDGK